MATIKLSDKSEKMSENYILAPMSGQSAYIEKFDAEDTGLTFSPTTDTGKAKAVAISDAYSSSVFSAVSYTPLVTLDASGRNTPINLVGNSNKNKITGGKGADTLIGGDGNDTLTGGDGADTFISSAGKNVISDYNATQGDVIMLNNVTPTKVSVSKQKVTITNSDKSTFAINNGKGQKLNVVDFNGNIIDRLNQSFGDTDLVYSGTTTGIIDTTFNTSVKTINASNASVDGGITEGVLTITGNSKANSIVGSDNVSNNIITAGAGKDTLTGGSGSYSFQFTSNGGTYDSTVFVHNTFVFAEGQGTNVITNYNSATDYIQLSSGSVYSYSTKKNDVIFTIALNGKKKTTLTVKDGKNKLITFLKPDGSVDTGNTMIYRNVTDYIVTDQATVSTDLTDVTDKLGASVKLIDASTGEYTPTVGTYIIGNTKANSIIGSRYSDTLTGGTGKDTMSGGHSSVDAADPYYDTFLYYSGSGNDVITDYIGTSDPAKSDVIKLANPDTTISTSALNTKKGAADVVLTVTNAAGKSKGTVTLKNTQDSLVTIIKTLDTLGLPSSEETIAPQKYGNKSLKVGTDAFPIEYKDGSGSGNATLRVVDTSFNAKVVTLDGSADTVGNLYLIGNSGKNVITGSASTVGANTLQGGKGNDTLNGTAGVVDVFVYDTVDGTDAIVSLEAASDIIKMASTDVHITASTLVTKKGANDVQLTIGKSKVVVKGIADTVDSGVKKKGKAVINYSPAKLTIDRGDGTHYRMTYAGALAKVEDDDVEENGILDFSPNALAATIDAGAVISDTTSVSTVDGAEVTVAVSSTERRTKNLGIVGNKNANTIIGATNGREHTTDSANLAAVTTMTGGKGNDVFIMASGGDILITDYNTNGKKEADKIALLEGQSLYKSGSVSGSSEDLLLTIRTTFSDETTRDNHITVAGGVGKDITIIDADGRENTQQFGVSTITITDKSSKNIMADGNVTAVVDGGRKKAINIATSGVRDASAGSISIQAGSGNDTINGGSSTDGISTLTGGKGKDVFYHTNANFLEVITDYEPSKDKLRFIQGLSIENITRLNDSDIQLHFSYYNQKNATQADTGTGDITIVGGVGKKISIVKERSEEYIKNKKTGETATRIAQDETTQIFGASEIEVIDADGSTIDASDGSNKDYLQVVDASQRSAKKPIVIVGNVVNDVGTNDKDLPYINSNTLIGGKGNDTIYSSKHSGTSTFTDMTGNAGADTFIYRGGNVTIEDYTWNKKEAKSDVIIISSDTSVAKLKNPIKDYFLPDTVNVASDQSGSIRFNGEDVTFIFGTVSGGITDSLTLKNAKGKMVTIVDVSGASLSHGTVYANPYEWTIANTTTEPTTLKAVYIDSSDTAYNAISASSRSKADTIQAGYEGNKATTNYIITGGKAADYLIGNEVVGTLVGGKGNDTLRSRGGGTDRSQQGASANYLTGGAGKDVFYFNPTTSTEHDIITDYEVGKDVLRLPEGYYIADATVTSAEYTSASTTRKTTLTGVQASLSASGVWEVAKNKKKTIAKDLTTTANDVILTIARTTATGDETVGTVTIWDAGGYSSIMSAGDDATVPGSSTAASLPAIGAYKISVATESTNAKGKTVVNTSALDLVSSEVVVVNADGTTIDVSANPNVVNILPSAVKPKRSKAMYVIGNSKANNITGTAKADTLSGNGSSNGFDTLTGDGGADIFLLDGQGDVIITDYSSAKGNYDKVRLGKGVVLDNGVASGSDLIFEYRLGTDATVPTHHATLICAAATKITLVGSDGKAGAQVYGSDKIEVANADGTKVDVGSNKNVKSIDASKRSKAVWLVGNTSTSTILGGKKNDTLDVSYLDISTSVTGAYLDAGNGNDLVYGSKGADTVVLGTGNDTFISNGGADTVETGKGKDVIIYNGGNMVITDLDAKNDRLELQSTIEANNNTYNLELLDYTVGSDTNVTLNLGYVVEVAGSTSVNNIKTPANTIVIVGGEDKALKLTNAEGKTDTLTLSDPNTLKVTNNDGANISPSANDTITTIDASKRTNPVNLTGNSYTTYIKGGTKADTIILTAAEGGTIQGGKGNDTMGGTAIGANGSYSGGNAGKMFYAYTTGDGKDVITNYTAGDVIVLGSAKTKINETKSKVTGNDYVLVIGSGNITLKGCRSTEISVQEYGSTTITTYNKQTATASTYMEDLVDELFADDIFADTDELTEIIQTAPLTTEQPVIQSTFELAKSSTLAAGVE